MPTHEQIAARLVPEHVYTTPESEVRVRRETGTSRLWQPRSPNEAGRSDALVLLAAVWKMYFDQDEDDLPGTVLHTFFVLESAMPSGNIQQIQQATFAAAAAIGEHIGGSDEG